MVEITDSLTRISLVGFALVRRCGVGDGCPSQSFELSGAAQRARSMIQDGDTASPEFSACIKLKIRFPPERRMQARLTMADLFVIDETAPPTMYSSSLLFPAYIGVVIGCRIITLIEVEESQHARHQTATSVPAIFLID